MDFFQGVVSEFLRADRSVFVNTECLIQLESGDILAKGKHWYCDAVAVNFRDETVYLCEVTYSKTLYSLVQRLKAWSMNWPAVCAALIRDSCVPNTWKVQPWLFIPEERQPLLSSKIAQLKMMDATTECMPSPRITYLEAVVPWKYRSWDRKISALEDDCDAQTGNNDLTD